MCAHKCYAGHMKTIGQSMLQVLRDCGKVDLADLPNGCLTSPVCRALGAECNQLGKTMNQSWP